LGAFGSSKKTTSLFVFTAIGPSSSSTTLATASSSARAALAYAHFSFLLFALHLWSYPSRKVMFEVVKV
jgi:hypothetical protein